MEAIFDDILFVISTDCFAEELFGEFSSEQIECVKQAAREAILEILDGENNYYIYADFSTERKEKTQQEFFAKLRAQGAGEKIQQKILLFYETIKGITGQLSTACQVIISVSARLYWLNTDRFTVPITDEIVDLVAMIEPLGLDRESQGFEWDEIWLNSPSDWDRFLMSIMDGIREVPYLKFLKITKFSSQLNFLQLWKKHLGEERFAVIRNYILTEAHAELDQDNPAAAKEIDRIMMAI